MRKITRKDFLKASGAGLGAISLAMLTGCGSSDSSSTSESTSSSENTGSSESTSSSDNGTETAAEDTFTYPMEATTLTINGTSDGGFDYYDVSDIPTWAQDYYYHVTIRDMTGVTLEDLGGAANSTTLSDNFNLMLVSGELPDIIIAPWSAYDGGAGQAIDDGYILDLNDYAEYMPNLMNYVDENPEVAAQILTPDGRLGFAPFVKVNPVVGFGIVIRQDWLDELGLDQPTTIDQMHDVLTAFKENYSDCTAPLTFESRWLFQQGGANCISSAWNTAYTDYILDGQVQFGPLTEEYKEFISTLHEWYAEGLLDPDFASVDKSTVQSKFSTDLSGVALQMTSNVDNCVDANAGTDYAVTALPSLVMNEGDEPEFSQQSIQHYDGGFCYSVSTSCKDVETACRYLDWRFSDEGVMMMNYGIEGVTYELDGDEVKLTELITDNEETPNAFTARGYVAWVQNRAGLSLDLTLGYGEEELSWYDAWTAHMEEYVLPTMNYTEDQNAVINAKWGDIDDYCQEYILRFVLGSEDMSNWDSFVDTIKSMGIEDVVAAKQEAYDTYLETVASLQ